MPTHIQQNKEEIAKIDSLASNGLGGVSNSLAYRIGEVERHFHSYEKWFGVAGTPSATHKADRVAKDIASFQLDGGNDAFGSWVQLLGSADTTETYDMHRLMVTAVERANSVHFIQIAFGADADAAVTAGTFTEVVYKPAAVTAEEAPLEVQMRRQAAGSLAWARVLSYDQDTGTINFYFGLHNYEG